MDRTTTLYIPQEKLTEYNRLLKSKNNLLEMGIGEFETIATFCTDLDNGYEAGLHIKSSDYKSGQIYAEMIIFDENCDEVAYETEYENMDGIWHIYDKGDNYNNCNKYTINVVGC